MARIVADESADHHGEVEGQGSFARRLPIRSPQANEQRCQRSSLAKTEDTVERALLLEERDEPIARPIPSVVVHFSLAHPRAARVGHAQTTGAPPTEIAT